MVLPDEQPTVATVTDPEKLQSQEFFRQAKAGYKVLIFTAAKKAVLYDPVGNRIVEVGPLQTNDKPEETTATDEEGDASTNTSVKKRTQ